MIREIILWIRVLLTPGCWLQNGKYSAQWDTVLREALKLHRFTEINAFRATLGPYQVWVANHPYASFTPPLTTARPSRRTILMAHDKLIADLLEEERQREVRFQMREKTLEELGHG